MSTPLTPRLSVLLPVYNGMPHLPAAAESMLAQTFADFELLLVDDGSTDGSGDVCDSYAASDGRVRVLRHAGGVNRGLVASLNLGLAEARGGYVARMDADDRSYPERLARQVAFLDAHPGVGVVGSRADCFDGETESVWGDFFTPELIRWNLLFTTPMVHSAVVFRRSEAVAVGGYDALYPHLEDYKFFYDLSKRTDLVNLEEHLHWISREGTTNISTVYRDVQRETALKVHREVARDHGFSISPRHERLLSLYAFGGIGEVEEAGMRVGLREAHAVGRWLHRLQRAFVSHWDPSPETRHEVDAFVRWRSTLLVEHVVTRGYASPSVARVMRLSWDFAATARRAARRLLRRSR